MNYLVYNNNSQAYNREQKVTDDCHFDDGVTTRYADILKHPIEDLWALIIDPLYTKHFTEQEISDAVELGPDWFPN